MKTKILKILCVITVSMAVILPRFSSVNAMSQALIERNVQIADNNGNYIGWFNNYAFLTTGSEMLNTSYFGVGPSAYYKTVSVLTVGFDTFYTGEIKIVFEGSLSNFQMCLVQGDNTGQYRWSGSNKVVYASFENCMKFDIILLSNTQYTASNIPVKSSSITFESLSVGSSGGGGSSAQSYMIPIESISAYEFTCSTLPDIQYNSGDVYPYIHIDSNNQNTNKTKYLNLSRFSDGLDNPTYFVFMSDTDLTMSGRISYDMTNSYVSLEVLKDIQSWYVYQMEIYNTNPMTSNGLFRINWLTDLNIIPIFLGHESECPESLKGICGLRTLDFYLQNIELHASTISNYIVYIYDLLNSQGDQSIADDLGDLTDDITDISDDERQITSGFTDDLDDFNTNIDLTDYDFLTSIRDTSTYYKTLLNTVFNESSSIRAMWVIPVICVIILALLGR